MEITIKVDDGNLVKVQVGNDEYRFVEGTEGNVVVSAKGEIIRRYAKNRKTGERKEYYEYIHPKSSGPGYLQVSVPERKDLKLVHRIVAETFIENPRGCREVDHINRDKFDNRVENLRWCTHSANMRNSDKPRTKIFWKDITAEDISSGEIYEFSRFRDIVQFALSRGWGNGWGTAIRRKLENGGGTAYGYFWTAKTRETKNIR